MVGDHLVKGVSVVVDGEISSQPATRFQFVILACRGDNSCIKHLAGQLNGCTSDAAAPRMNQYSLPLPEVPEPDESLPSGQKRFWNRSEEHTSELQSRGQLV